MKIAEQFIGGKFRPYVVAEISGNHGGDKRTAMELIKAAKWAGADAVKTQCYEPNTITLDCSTPDFIMQSGLWRGRKLYDLYKKAHTPFAWHRDLYNCAYDTGISIFSSVFDKSSVDLLEGLGCPAYKIASFEIVDTPLIEYVSTTKKPLIISTGMASVDEVDDADQASDGKAAFLFCTSEYPAEVAEADLGNYLDLQHRVPHCITGVSDHTMGWMVPVLATAMGASIIEKHLKLPGKKSEDEEFSMEPKDFRAMTELVKEAHMACQAKPVSTSNPSRQARRSLYAVQEIKKGEVFTEDNIRSIRPGYGLPPKELPKLLGKKARKDYRKGERLTWNF